MNRGLLQILPTPSLRQSQLDQVQRVAAPAPLDAPAASQPLGGGLRARRRAGLPRRAQARAKTRRQSSVARALSCRRSASALARIQSLAQFGQDKAQKKAPHLGREIMSFRRKTACVHRTLAFLGLLASTTWFGATFAPPAAAAQLGQYFPIPNSLSISGVPRDSLLKLQSKWLQNGLDNLKKARTEAEAALEKAKAGATDQVAAAEENLKKIDEMIAQTQEELALSDNNDSSHEIQTDRKRKLMLHLNQWINELNRLATEQMKIAILKDGAEALTAQHRNYQLSEQADNLEKAKTDPSILDWASK
jgi:hypothetical protein